MTFDPDWTIAPGETLRDWCEENHVPHRAAAAACGRMPVEMFERILSGKQRITKVIAEALEHRQMADDHPDLEPWQREALAWVREREAEKPCESDTRCDTDAGGAAITREAGKPRETTTVRFGGALDVEVPAPCPVCGGTGRQVADGAFRFRVPCPSCGGTGHTETTP